MGPWIWRNAVPAGRGIIMATISPIIGIMAGKTELRKFIGTL